MKQHKDIIIKNIYDILSIDDIEYPKITTCTREINYYGYKMKLTIQNKISLNIAIMHQTGQDEVHLLDEYYILEINGLQLSIYSRSNLDKHLIKYCSFIYNKMQSQFRIQMQKEHDSLVNNVLLDLEMVNKLLPL